MGPYKGPQAGLELMPSTHPGKSTDMYTAEDVLLPLQRLQLAHDQLAHFDMLSFDLHKRLKHMVLHFFKYAGRIEAAKDSKDEDVLRGTLLDAFVICMATANALNLSLGEHINASAETNNIDALAHSLGSDLGVVNLHEEAVRALVIVGGRMAKAVESLDHMERGDCRAAIESLLPQLTTRILALLSRTSLQVECRIRERFSKIEEKSIFTRAVRQG